MASLTIDLGRVVGPVFVGMLFFYTLYGVTLAQIAFYWRNYSQDRIQLRTLVAVLFLLDTSKAVVDGQLFWFYLIQNHENLTGLSGVTASFGAQNVLAWITVLISQCFYIYNIHILLRSQLKWYTVPVTAVGLLLALFSFAAGMGLVYELYAESTEASATARVNTTGIAQSVGTLVTDVWITLMLSWTLHRSKTGYKPTESLLSRLVMYTVDRGIILTTLQMVILVTFLYDDAEGSIVSDVFYFGQSILYSNCVFAVLNVRRHISETSAPVSDIQLGDMSSSAECSSPPCTPNTPGSAQFLIPRRHAAKRQAFARASTGTLVFARDVSQFEEAAPGAGTYTRASVGEDGPPLTRGLVSADSSDWDIRDL